jgi:predicted TIM-barrel fold metal-dependent hydrolase
MNATLGQLRAMLRNLQLDRVVLIQLSVYGTDNACMLDAMDQLERARGIAVLPADVSEDDTAELHRRGIRGLRVNIATSHALPLEAIRQRLHQAATLCERHRWHVQVYIPADAIEPLAPLFLALPVPVVIDHFGMIAASHQNGAVSTLMRLLQSGKAWVKFSGAYRISDDPADRRVDALAKTLIAANPDRIVWGSDWPHTPPHGGAHDTDGAEQPFRNIDTRALLHLLPRWLDDSALIERVLVRNPASLYDFT